MSTIPLEMLSPLHASKLRYYFSFEDLHYSSMAVDRKTSPLSPPSTVAPTLRPPSPLSNTTVSSGPRVSSHEARRALLGPFHFLLAVSAFDLERSLFGKRKPLHRSLVATSIYVVLFILFFIRMIIHVMTTAKPLTYAWSESNIVGFIAVHGISCSVSLAKWTSTGLFSLFHSSLHSASRRQSSLSLPPSSLHSSRVFVAALVLSSLYIVVLLLSSTKAVLQGTAAAASNGTSGWSWVLSKENLFGLDPILSVWMGVATVLAITSFVLMHRLLAAEWSSLNEEIRDLISSSSLAPSLPSLSHRLSSLLSFTATLSDRVHGFASVSTFAAVVANVNAIFELFTLAGEMNILAVAVAIIWAITTMVILFLTLLPARTVQAHIAETSALLLSDPAIFGCQEKMTMVSLMVKRIESMPTKIYLFNALPVNLYTLHAIVFLCPNTATALSILKKIL